MKSEKIHAAVFKPLIREAIALKRSGGKRLTKAG